MGEGSNPSDLMTKRSVATGAFDLVVGDMFLMHELRGIFRTQEDGFIMTFQTLSFRDMAVSLNHTEMALHTGHPSCNILSVIKTPPINFNISLRLDMAGGTPSDGT
jgi:hypothetical protein